MAGFLSWFGRWTGGWGMVPVAAPAAPTFIPTARIVEVAGLPYTARVLEV